MIYWPYHAQNNPIKTYLVPSPRLPLVKAQRSFLSGIGLSREQHGPKVKVTEPPMKKRKFRTLGVLPFDICFVCYFPRYLILRNTITSEKTKYRMVKPREFWTYVFFIGGSVTFTLGRKSLENGIYHSLYVQVKNFQFSLQIVPLV
jgi:hypothetical protein